MGTKRIVIIRNVLVLPNNSHSDNSNYDSGWLKWRQQLYILYHNLGTKELFIYVMYKNNEGLIQSNTQLVQWWALNEQSISVRSADLSTDEKFRILIWKL